MKTPRFDQLMLPVMQALVNLGGSGSTHEIYEEVVKLEKFDDSVLNKPHNPERGNQSVINYRLGWARTYLKKAGYLENSARGVWALTPKGKQNQKIDTDEVVKYVRSLSEEDRKKNQSKDDPKISTIADDVPEELLPWREKLYHVLTAQMTPDAFERLTKRILRESGFINVEVTGKTADGGIDGKGVARICGIISFHIVFQCKKYKGSVGSPEIRDFRGAMTGRTNKGLFITTGTFTEAARKEAARDGAPPIDLIDGEQLANKLKEFSLGIKTEMVEKVTVDPNWFLSL